MADIQEILQVVKEFKYWSNPERFTTMQDPEVQTKSYDIVPFFIPTQLKENHFHEENSIQSSLDLSVKRLVQWPDLKKNTVFQQPRYLLWLESDGLLVSPHPLDCYVVHLAKDPPISQYIGPKWAIFSDKDSYHFFEKCLKVSIFDPSVDARGIGRN